MANKVIDHAVGKLTSIDSFKEEDNKAVDGMVESLEKYSEVGWFTKFFKCLFSWFSHTNKIYTLDRLVKGVYKSSYSLDEI